MNMELLVPDLLCHACVITAVFVACWFLVPQRARADLPQRVAVTDTLFSVPFYLWLSFLAVNATLEGWDTLKGRYSYHYTLSYVVKMIAHVPIVIYTEQPSQAALMVVHHGLSLACYSHSLLRMRMLWWGAFDGLCEKLQLKERFPRVTLVNGFLFWASYIPFRLVLFPVWLYWFYLDTHNNEELPWEQLSNLEKYAYPFTNVVLLVLSSFWFIKISRGFMKLVRPTEEKKQALVAKKRT